MSYERLGGTITAVATVALCFLSFRWGVRFGNQPMEAAKQDLKLGFPHKKRKESEEMKRMGKILENIENYGGDGSNQRKI